MGCKDASRLDAVTFHKLVYRLAAYSGAVAARAAAQQERGSGAGSPRAVQPGGSADVRARLRASQAMPVASAAELVAASAPVSGLPALGTITRERCPPRLALAAGRRGVIPDA